MLNRNRRVWISACALAGVLATSASGQTAYAAGTLGHVVSSLEEVATRVEFSALDPDASARLGNVATRLGAANAFGYHYSEIARAIAAARPSFGAISKVNRGVYDARLAPSVLADIAELRQIANNPLRRAMDSRLGEAATDTLLAPLDSLHVAILRAALGRNLEKLKRYEIKYGPSSPTLNAPEVLLNFVAQRLPAFRPTPDGWPSPNEMMASYSTTDLTRAADPAGETRFKIVSSARIGIRRYHFSDGRAFMRTVRRVAGGRHTSVGLALMGREDRPLSSPIGNGARTGVFIGVADTYVSLIGGPNRRIVLSRNLKIVPYLF